MKKKKIALLLTLCMAAGGTVYAQEETVGQESAQEVLESDGGVTQEAGEAGDASAATALSDDWSDYQIEMDGTVYSFPMTYEELISHGWMAEDETELSQELASGVATRVSERYQPRPETVRRFGELVWAHLAPFLQLVPEDQPEFTAMEVVNFLNQILRMSCQTRFEADLASQRSSILVDQAERRILIPAQREPRTYTREEVLTLMLKSALKSCSRNRSG